MTLPPDPTEEPLTDARLLALPAHRRAVCEELPVALDTGPGGRLVHGEPGHRLDAGAAFTDPFDPNDRPLAVHIAREVAPAIVANNGATWLNGIDDLVDRDQAGAFVASRFAYRRLLRRSGWLLVPSLIGLAVFWS